MLAVPRGSPGRYTDTITLVLTQTLQRCKPFDRLKIAVYHTIHQMLVALGPVLTASQLDDVVQHALEDCSRRAGPFGQPADDAVGQESASPEAGTCAAVRARA